MMLVGCCLGFGWRCLVGGGGGRCASLKFLGRSCKRRRHGGALSVRFHMSDQSRSDIVGEESPAIESTSG